MSNIYIVIHTDSRLLGCRVTEGFGPSGNRWKSNEIAHNVLELKTTQIGILAYCKGEKYKHARIISGNATAVSYVNSKGSIEPTYFHKIAKEIWIWFNSIELWVSAAHILVTENCKADSFSSNFKKALNGNEIVAYLKKLHLHLE